MLLGFRSKKSFLKKLYFMCRQNNSTNNTLSRFRNNNHNDFIHFYQMIDVLIIDDVHDLSGKEKTQDAFFHIFNHIHQKGKQLVITFR